MKKKLIGLLTVLLTFAMVGAPLAVSADARTANTVTLTVGGGTASVLPGYDEHTNLIPLLGIPATRDQGALVRELKRVINATGTTFVTTDRFDHTDFLWGGYERGTVKTWYFGNCNFKGFEGTGILKYYMPEDVDGEIFNDTPYYEFLFSVDRHRTIRLSDGTYSYADVFECNMHELIWRMDGFEDYGHSFLSYGPNGEQYYIEIGVYDNYATTINYNSPYYVLRYTIAF